MLRKIAGLVVMTAVLGVPAFGLVKPVTKKAKVMHAIAAPAVFVYHVPGKIGRLFKHGNKTPKAKKAMKGLKPIDEQRIKDCQAAIFMCDVR